MSIIFLLIPLSVVIATGFLVAFIWAVRSGQYEDTVTPSMRLLLREPMEGAESEAEPSRRTTGRGAGEPSLTTAKHSYSADKKSNP
jgi:cbb3-type cytochrome oxidase maturation protein